MAKPENDRGLRASLPVEKHRIGRHYQVDSRLLNVGKRPDCPFKLALQRALVSDLLVKLCLSPRHFVEQLKSHAPAMRLALRCSHHARCIELVGWHADFLAIGADLVGNVLRVELCSQRLCIRRIEVFVKRFVIRRRNQPHKQGQHQGCRTCASQK